jgi:hypothetical protein
MGAPATGAARPTPLCAAAMPDDQNDPNEHNSNFLAGVVFALLLALLIAGVWVFPRVYAFMSQQDCIASGRTNCVRFAPTDTPSAQ